MVFVFILVALSVVALLWCLLGFSRAVKEPRRVIGLLIRPYMSFGLRTKQAKVLEFPIAKAGEVMRDRKKIYSSGSSGAKRSD